MRGEILRYDDGAGAGLISGDDGQRYAFQRADLQQLQPISAGDRVDFIVGADSAAKEIVLLGAGVAATTYSGPKYTGDDLELFQYFRKCLTKFADGQGRARRKEYWSFTLFQVAFVWAPLIFGSLLVAASEGYGDLSPGQVFGVLIVVVACGIGLALLIPGIAVTIRRFHDVGLSGWLVLLGLIPYAGGLFVFIVSLWPSQDRVNAYGPVPKPRTA